MSFFSAHLSETDGTSTREISKCSYVLSRWTESSKPKLMLGTIETPHTHCTQTHTGMHTLHTRAYTHAHTHTHTDTHRDAHTCIYTGRHTSGND